MSEAEQPEAPVRLAYIRLAIGFVQGLGAWQLIRGADQPWSAAHPGVFAALVLVTAFGPLIPLAGLGHLRLSTVLIWTGAACILLSSLAAYDLWREPHRNLRRSEGFATLAERTAHLLQRSSTVYHTPPDRAGRRGASLVAGLSAAL